MSQNLKVNRWVFFVKECLVKELLPFCYNMNDTSTILLEINEWETRLGMTSSVVIDSILNSIN